MGDEHGINYDDGICTPSAIIHSSIVTGGKDEDKSTTMLGFDTPSGIIHSSVVEGVWTDGRKEGERAREEAKLECT